MKLGRTRAHVRAYTLIEALVASSILAVGVGAAASMSLAFVTQEEISERSAKAFNHLENAAALHRAGVDPAAIPGLLPHEPVVASLTFTDRTLAATGLGSVPSTLITVTWNPSGATGSAGLDRWTGGRSDTTRTASVEVVRTSPVLDSPLPRVDHFD